MNGERKYIKIWLDNSDILKDLETNEVGELILGLMDYAETGIEPVFEDRAVRICYKSMRKAMDREDAFNAKQAENASKSVNGRRRENICKPNEAKPSQTQPTQAKLSQTEPNEAKPSQTEPNEPTITYNYNNKLITYNDNEYGDGYAHEETEPEPEETEEEKELRKSGELLAEVFDEGRKIGFKSEKDKEWLNAYVADYGGELVLQGMEEAGKSSSGPPSLRYLEAILKRLKSGKPRPNGQKRQGKPVSAQCYEQRDNDLSYRDRPNFNAEELEFLRSADAEGVDGNGS